MSETKHTPGPWQVEDDGVHISGSAVMICRMFVADDFPCIDDGDDAEECNEMAQANSHLIAAAPDLLNACQLTQSHVSGNFEDGYTIQVTGHQMEAIRAAIAKASEREKRS